MCLINILYLIFIETVPVEFTQRVFYFANKQILKCATVTNAYVCLLFVHQLKIIGFLKLVKWDCNAQRGVRGGGEKWRLSL